MGFASHEHMEKAFAWRREQIVGDNLQLKTDVDVYNDLNRGNARHSNSDGLHGRRSRTSGTSEDEAEKGRSKFA